MSFRTEETSEKTTKVGAHLYRSTVVTVVTILTSGWYNHFTSMLRGACYRTLAHRKLGRVTRTTEYLQIHVSGDDG